ncbi:MAG: ABC transporter substrate-binding protein [Tissierellia bacterium]|nr:ABC transporter substrate-binding protein [Tissierellia bacterium]
MTKRIKLAGLLMALSLVLVACGGGNGTQEAQGGEGEGQDTLTIAMEEDPSTLDPMEQNAIYSEQIIKQIFDTLVRRTPQGDMELMLAESIDQEDDLNYVITLKEGVKFSNGEDLTSGDVQFTLERLAESTNYAYIFEKIDPNSYDASDPLVLKFTLLEPDASFAAALSHPAASIVNKKAIEEAGDMMGDQPVGTGPFKLDEWVKQDSISLSYNENYWGETPDFSKMVFRMIPEGSNRTIELESGQVDIALGLAANDIEKVEANENLEVHRVLDNSVHFMGMDVTKPPFDKLEAREAVYHAIDTQALIEAVYLGVGQVATGPINPNFDYSIADEIDLPEFNPDKAKDLLDQAGVAEGTSIKLYTSQDQTQKDLATIMQAQLAEVGLDVEVVSLEWGTFFEAIRDQEHNMFLMSWTPSIVDPHYTLYTPYHSRNMGVGPNFMYYSSPELDRLIEEGVRLPNGDERAQVYRQAQELLMEDKPVLYTLYGEQVVGTQSYVKNFEPDPSGSGIYYNVTLEK